MIIGRKVLKQRQIFFKSGSECCKNGFLVCFGLIKYKIGHTKATEFFFLLLDNVELA